MQGVWKGDERQSMRGMWLGACASAAKRTIVIEGSI